MKRFYTGRELDQDGEGHDVLYYLDYAGVKDHEDRLNIEFKLVDDRYLYENKVNGYSGYCEYQHPKYRVGRYFSQENTLIISRSIGRTIFLSENGARFVPDMETKHQMICDDNIPEIRTNFGLRFHGQDLYILFESNEDLMEIKLRK